MNGMYGAGRPRASERAARALCSSVLAALLLAGCDRLVMAPPEPPPPLVNLGSPIGEQTRASLAYWTTDPAECRAMLDLGQVTFTPVEDRVESETCRIHDAGSLGLDAGAVSTLTPEAPVMTCRTAAAFSLWRRQSVEPAARELLGAEVSRIEHWGTYACRNIYGRAAGRASAHATAEAIDIAVFHLSDGRMISVYQRWNDEGPEGQFLRRVRDDACRVFGVTLSPDYNVEHADHLHLELGSARWSRCS